jgi:hypothetical protein
VKIEVEKTFKKREILNLYEEFDSMTMDFEKNEKLQNEKLELEQKQST